MKTYLAGLQNSTQTSYANNGKTTLLGRTYQKTINSQSVIGPTLTQYIDIETITGLSPIFSYYNPTTNHLFVLAGVTPNPSVLLFNFNSSTGAYSYVGKIICNLPNVSATTHIFRSFKVYESGGYIVPVIATTGSIVINGGVNIAWNCTASQFTPGGTGIFPAYGSNQNAMYFIQDGTGATFGCYNDMTTLSSLACPQQSSNSLVNTTVWAQNGTAAAMSLFQFLMTNTPSVQGLVTNGVSAQTTAYAGTSPAAYFTMGASQNGYNQITSSAALFEAVVLMNGTGNVPTGFTAWTPGTVQTTAGPGYYVRDLQQVGGNWYFNLASSGAGAAVTPTSSTSSFTMLRAAGLSTSMFSLKTGTLPALAGNLLNNSFQYAKPVSAPANPSLNGYDCFAIVTSSTAYMGLISDLTSGTTLWPSNTPVTISGAGQIVTPVATFGVYSGKNTSNGVDKFVVASNGSSFAMFPLQASTLTAEFGGTEVQYLEGTNPTTVQFGVATLNGMDVNAGWLFIVGTAVGQRGIIFTDLQSDANFGVAGVISPVLNLPSGTMFKYINTLEQLFNYTDSMNFWVRSAATSGDATFSSGTLPVGSPVTAGSTSNGWTNIQTASDMSAYAVGPYFQFAVTFQILTLLANTPAQLYDLVYSVLPPAEQSDYWTMDNDNTTQNNASPNYVSWRLQTAYSSSVPTLYARIYDTSGNLIFNANTSTNPTAFQYSTNDGTSWNSLGTIPNTPDTRVRVLVTPTPSVTAAFPSLRES
jgi:hypothetical protein